ncbi:histone-lysine N-methyltransferase ASHH3 [Phoenix dactylifera]|uniref:Histone-lysine N-methyltransferase ASHH3 n=1 Tax=Phoenix dactylifera TaxID=42345 RepID=A0A8B7CF94_PHODC|nr:histone-lysine N-methyltransferase ASHH3 [Phoenix dactylifera]
MKKRSGIAGHAFHELLQQLGDDPNPLEFQLPNWLKKQKSMPYTFIRRNVYLTKKIKRRAEDDGIFCSCSPSSGASAVCDKDCLCGMLLSCCSQSCNCGDLCVNKPFQYRPVKKMKLIKTEKCGAGLVTDEDIRQGDFVIEYVGEVIDDKTCEERLWKMKHCGETNFYLCEINRDMVIDATYKGNKSRFINHSCQPNTEMQKWTIDGETRIGIFATRDISKGEELTYDYQFVQFGADQDCYCGAIGCRQKLGSKPSKLKLSSSDTALQLVLCEMAASSPTVKALLYGKDGLPNGRSDIGSSYLSVPYKKKSSFQNCIGELVRIWSPLYKRYYGGVILEFNCCSKKHTIITEDEQIEVLDMSKEDWDLL